MDMHNSLFPQRISFSVQKKVNPYVKVWIITRTLSLATSTLNGSRTAHASDVIKNPVAIYFESHNRGKWHTPTQRFKGFNNSVIIISDRRTISLDLKMSFLSWFLVSRGSQATVAASSCREIYFKENSAKDGFYWLIPRVLNPRFSLSVTRRMEEVREYSGSELV